jgi:hypothetical protein
LRGKFNGSTWIVERSEAETLRSRLGSSETGTAPTSFNPSMPLNRSRPLPSGLIRWTTISIPAAPDIRELK